MYAHAVRSVDVIRPHALHLTLWNHISMIILRGLNVHGRHLVLIYSFKLTCVCGSGCDDGEADLFYIRSRLPFDHPIYLLICTLVYQASIVFERF